MHQRALVLALMAAGMALPGAARAADDCSQMFVYSVNQFCRTLSNGFSQCQPVGMVGPAPNCAKPGVPPIMPVPLAPPVTQAPPSYNYMAPFPAPSMAPPPAVVQLPEANAAPSVAAKPVPPAAVSKSEQASPNAAPESPKVAQESSKAVVTPSTSSLPAPAAPAVAAIPAAPTVMVAPAVKPDVVAVPIAPPVVPAAAAPTTPSPVPPAASVASVAAPSPESPVAPTVSAPVAALPPAVEASAPTAEKVPVAISTAPSVPAAPVAPAEPAKPAPQWPAQLVLQDGMAHFEFDRAELSEKARAELDAWLTQPIPKGKTLRVTGHADRLGPAAYNLKLSGRRAETVKKYLVGKGVEKQGIHVVAKGESEPVKHCKGGATKATIACLAPNRRVEIDPE